MSMLIYQVVIGKSISMGHRDTTCLKVESSMPPGSWNAMLGATSACDRR